MNQNFAKPVADRQAPLPVDASSGWRPPFTFPTVGATIGLALGFVEAGFLYYIPRFSGLTRPDVRAAIWIIAPLADAPPLMLAGLLLGWIAALPRRARPVWQAGWAAAGIGLGAAYLGWMLLWFRVGIGFIVPRPLSALSPFFYLALTPVIYFIVGCVASAMIFRLWWRRLRPVFVAGGQSNFRLLAGLNATIFAVLSVVLLVVRLRGQQPFNSPSEGPLAARPRNNVVLIMLDTVRADHLSCYGYARSTTPNLDRLAGQGVLFQDAVAPTSWTLPSLASVLTGLLPHQHGANWQEALDPHPITLAEIMKSQGYQTAAFNANSDFGLAGWRLDKGFDVYADAHNWLRHNLAITFAGQSLYQLLFREFVSFNEFDHLDAEQINRQVFDWLDHRSGQPYFLFINYMDAHRPYVPPAPYDRRFGRIPRRILWNLSYALRDGHLGKPASAHDRQDIIDSYDNSLSYLDEQIARLINKLMTSRDAAKTFVIVAGDHGESFGEHGTYDHGWNLYREVLHVPLIVAGPGIPAGRRVERPAALRELFPTVIQLALESADLPIRRASLSRFWATGNIPETSEAPVISELSLWTRDEGQTAVMSLWDARWHYLRYSSGREEIFDRQADEAEKNNLAGSSTVQMVLPKLHSQMESVVAGSLTPWRAVAYLSPLDRPDMPFFRRAITNPSAFPPLGWPVGSSQALFAASSSQQEVGRPTHSQQDLLRSLPYH